MKNALSPSATFPIIYKMIPTQYVFLVEKNGLLKIQQVTDVPREIQFKSEKEAREYVENYNQQL